MTPMPVVAVYGNFDKGKTWLMSQLFCKQLPSNYNIRTPGICN